MSTRRNFLKTLSGMALLTVVPRHVLGGPKHVAPSDQLTKGIIGGGGLGKIAINYGYYRFNVVMEFFATALLVVLVQILQTVGTKLAIKCDKRIQK